jgi:hypothetical protein
MRFIFIISALVQGIILFIIREKMVAPLEIAIRVIIRVAKAIWKFKFQLNFFLLKLINNAK